jgi:hypothetical protein
MKRNKSPLVKHKSQDLFDLRQEWLTGTITNGDIYRIISNIYPYGGTYKGKLLSYIVLGMVEELKKYGKEDLMKLGYFRPDDFLLIYNLDKDKFDRYPVKESTYEKAMNSDNLVVVYDNDFLKI